MSRNNMTRNNNSVRKPFCAHCHNTGEPENVYSSHYPRSLPDRTGKTTITCPKLRATECAYCYEFGHTRKFCPVLKANQRAREIEERKIAAQQQQQEQQASAKKQSQQKNLGGYAALVEDDSDEEDEEHTEVETVKEEWPALSGATASVTTASVTTGYAAMAAKPVRVYEPEPQTPVSAYQVINRGDRMIKTETQAETYVPRGRVPWTDLTDDEEEDDEYW